MTGEQYFSTDAAYRGHGIARVCGGRMDLTMRAAEEDYHPVFSRSLDAVTLHASRAWVWLANQFVARSVARGDHTVG